MTKSQRAEARAAVLRALAERPPGMSDRAIGRALGLRPGYVSRVRREVHGDPPDDAKAAAALASNITQGKVCVNHADRA